MSLRVQVISLPHIVFISLKYVLTSGIGSLEKGMAIHSNILTWRIPYRETWQATIHGVAKIGHD